MIKTKKISKRKYVYIVTYSVNGHISNFITACRIIKERYEELRRCKNDEGICKCEEFRITEKQVSKYILF